MRSEKQYLTAFNKIRENISIGSVLQRDQVNMYPDRIQNMFPGESGKERLKSVMPNAILWVLLFLEDATMGLNESCTMDDIVEGLSGSAMIAALTQGLPVDFSVLGEYIVVEVLQNGGTSFWYNCYDFETGREMSEIYRLVEETGNRYRLSSTALDFLFRQKEIDNLLNYDFATFKLRVHMTKGAYLEAYMAARELLQSVQRMRISLRDWEIKFKDNITQAKVKEYRQLTDSVRDLFRENEKNLKDLEAAAKSQEELLKETVNADEKTRTEALVNVGHLQGVIDTLNIVQHEQNALLAYQIKLRQEYAERLEQSIMFREQGRLSFKRDIVDPILKNDEYFSAALESIFLPLMLPVSPKVSSIEDILRPQDLFEERTEAEDEGIDTAASCEKEWDSVIREREDRNSAIIRFILDRLLEKKIWRTSELVAEMTDEDRAYFTEENAFMHIVLEFSSACCIDVREMIVSARADRETAEGEYNIAWHIASLLSRDTPLRTIHIINDKKEFVFTAGTKQVRMTDLLWIGLKEDLCIEEV